MTQTIWCSDKLRVDWSNFIEFVQQQANRLAQGQARYGTPEKSKRYMTRLGLELKAYRRTGNRELLLNIANYSWLESVAPENKKFHWDNTAESATRGKV